MCVVIKIIINFEEDINRFRCIQQWKTTFLLSIQESLACARASKLSTRNMYIARARCESQPVVGSSCLNTFWSCGRAIGFKFFSLIFDSSVCFSVGIQSARDSVPETLGSNSAFSSGRQLVSFSSRKLFVRSRVSKLTTKMYVCNTCFDPRCSWQVTRSTASWIR